MSSDEYPDSPLPYGRIARLRGFLPLNSEEPSPMATHGQGTLTSLIRTRSSSSLHKSRRPSSFRERRDTYTAQDDEESGPRLRRNSRGEETENTRTSDERRLSAVLNGPQMRSQRLIGNSNPRYRWEKYWKTEEELKNMTKPVYESKHLTCSSS